MAYKVMIMGESGTGKSTSLRNLDPDTTAVVNPVGKPLPFKGGHKFTTLDGVTDADKITSWIKKQIKDGKKTIVVDDFQYMLAVPYMHRIKETGWDKYNDFGANYFDIIEVCNELPEDVIVYYLTHMETLESGLTTVKLIGKLLREKITIEGLFTIVLRTGVNEAKYYFYTQNSGKDTVKSPMGMFPAYAIENDLKYVDDKIRSYYEIGDGFKTEEEMAEEDAAVASDLTKEEAIGKKRGRSKKKAEEKVEEDLPVKEEPETLKEDTCFFIPDTGNYVMKHAGDTAPENGKVITKEEFIAGAKAIATGVVPDSVVTIPDEVGDAEEVPFDEYPIPDMPKPVRRSRRKRGNE